MDEQMKLILKIGKILGYVPVGTSDLLSVLTHPDVIEDTKAFIKSKED